MAQRLRYAATVLLALPVVWCAGCDRNQPVESRQKAVAQSTREEDAPTEVAAPPRLPRQVAVGVCLAHSWQNGGARGYGTDSSQKTLEHLRDLGVDAVSLTPFGWMSSLQAARVHGAYNGDMPDGGESPRRLIEAAKQAHRLGLQVVLKPHLWIRGGRWRAEISPRTDDGQPAWDQWWASYRAFTLFYARLAAKIQARSFVVGVELESAIAAAPDQFTQLIEAVDAVYGGRLVYGANWNEEVPAPVWRGLDAVGVQFYPPVSDTPDPSLAELRRGLRSPLRRWSELAARLDKPLVLTEVGYTASSVAARAPHQWPKDIDDSAVDEHLQAKLYRALFAEISLLETIDGVYVWKYFTDPNTDEGGAHGFSPRDNPAESVLREVLAVD